MIMKNMWDEIFSDERFCSDLNPREFVKDNIASISPASGPILDVGCGCGRHLVYLAASGYDVYGIDLSEVAIAKAHENLRKFDLSAVLQKGPMWEIPFDGVQFTAALSINVLNHGMPDEVAASVSAIAQRLVPGGLFLLTLLTTKDYRASGEQVELRTFICDKGPEKGVLHTVFDERSAAALLEGPFAIDSTEVASGKATLPGGEQVNQEFFRIRAVKQ